MIAILLENIGYDSELTAFIKIVKHTYCTIAEKSVSLSHSLILFTGDLM